MTPRLASGCEDGQPDEQRYRGRDERRSGGDGGEDLAVAERARDAGARLLYEPLVVVGDRRALRAAQMCSSSVEVDTTGLSALAAHSLNEGRLIPQKGEATLTRIVKVRYEVRAEPPAANL